MKEKAPITEASTVLVRMCFLSSGVDKYLHLVLSFVFHQMKIRQNNKKSSLAEETDIFPEMSIRFLIKSAAAWPRSTTSNCAPRATQIDFCHFL